MTRSARESRVVSGVRERRRKIRRDRAAGLPHQPSLRISARSPPRSVAETRGGSLAPAGRFSIPADPCRLQSKPSHWDARPPAMPSIPETGLLPIRETESKTACPPRKNRESRAADASRRPKETSSLAARTRKRDTFYPPGHRRKASSHAHSAPRRRHGQMRSSAERAADTPEVSGSDS